MQTLDELLEQITEEQSVHNGGRDRKDTGKKSACPYCNNTGWELYWDGDYEYAKECRCGIRQKQIMENKLAFANIPQLYADMQLADFRTDIYETAESRACAEEVVEAIHYWLDHYPEMQERGVGLYLYSKTKGSGKTRMAVSVANELLQKGEQVKFATSQQILSAIKASWSGDSECSEEVLLKDLLAVQVLVIDDFGAEIEGRKESAWINDRFWRIIDGRYVSGKVTIFTSNDGLDDLNYDDRIPSRIRESTCRIAFPEENVRDRLSHDARRNFVFDIWKYREIQLRNRRK